MGAGDISREPLQNQSSVGEGSDRRLATVIINSVGICTTRTPVDVTNTRQQITITAGNRTIEFQNQGTNSVYYGGSDVTSTNGIRLFPNSTKIFANVRDDFSIFLVTATGETATVRISEFT